MTLTPWRVAYPDSAVGANTIGDLVWLGLQLRSLEANPTLRNPWSRESLRNVARGRDNYKNRKAC